MRRLIQERGQSVKREEICKNSLQYTIIGRGAGHWLGGNCTGMGVNSHRLVRDAAALLHSSGGLDQWYYHTTSDVSELFRRRLL
jgi:hypothetical protein